MADRRKEMLDAYIRISQLGERTEDEATATYIELCYEWAERNSVVIDEIEEDTDVSGSVAVKDRKLERLVQKVENGESDGIVTPWLDRLGRDNIESCMVEKRVTDAGGRLVAVKDGYDSNAPNSRLLFQMRAAIAEDGFRRAKENYAAGIKRRVEQRAYIYKTPFGYAKDDMGRLVVHEAHAKIVRELFERRAAGQDLGTLTRWMGSVGAMNPHQGKNENGEPNPPRPFVKTGVAGLIRNRAYLGEISVQVNDPKRKGNPETIKDYHEPIITHAIFNAANSVKGAFHPRNRKLVDQVKFRGKVYCATCGKRCKVGGATVKGERLAGYTCTSRGCVAHASMRAARLDPYVEQMIMTAVASNNPNVMAVIEGDTRYADALADVEVAQRLHDELRDDTEAQSIMGTKDWLAALKVRKDSLTLAKQALTKARPTNFKRGKKWTAIEDATILIEKVVIKPLPEGASKKTSVVADRLEIYLTGSETPYVPKPLTAKNVKWLKAQIDAHTAEAAA
jgi:DNA invertase Pin-like site-specific DNA recombinase